MAAADIVATLERALPGVTFESWDASDQAVVVVPAAALVDAARVLRDTPELNFSFLAEMTAADYWPKDPRFEVVYHLANIGVKDFPRPGASGTGQRLRAQGPRLGRRRRAADDPGDLAERQLVRARGVRPVRRSCSPAIPDLRRILMPEDWDGYPARKDYPVQVKVPVEFGSPTQVTEDEFVRNLEAHRVHAKGASPGTKARPGA